MSRTSPPPMPMEVSVAQLHQLNGLSALQETITLANKGINVLSVSPVFPLQVIRLVIRPLWQEVTQAHSS